MKSGFERSCYLLGFPFWAISYRHDIDVDRSEIKGNRVFEISIRADQCWVRARLNRVVRTATAVHPSSVLGLVGYDDTVIPGYQKLTAAVRPYGMRIFSKSGTTMARCVAAAVEAIEAVVRVCPWP